jgi:hypothetical protein
MHTDFASEGQNNDFFILDGIITTNHALRHIPYPTGRINLTSQPPMPHEQEVSDATQGTCMERDACRGMW